MKTASDVYRYRSPFRWAEYRLVDEGVAVTEKAFTRLTRALVPYDWIPAHSMMVTHTSKWFFWTAVVSGFLFLVMAGTLALGGDVERSGLVLYGALCIITVVGYVVTRRTAVVFRYGDSHLSLFLRSVTDDGPRAFIEAMQAQKIEFLRQRMARRATDLPRHENLRYLVGLREAGLLDEPGFVQLRAYVEGLAPDQGPYGFPVRGAPLL